MKASVRADGRWSVVTAFGGREYTKGEWRPVPDGFEAAAEAHPLLVTSGEVAAEGQQPEVADESSRADLQRGGGRRSRSRNSQRDDD